MLITHRRKRQLSDFNIISRLNDRALISCTVVHYLNYHTFSGFDQPTRPWTARNRPRGFKVSCDVIKFN